MTNTSVAEILGETEMKETQKRCQLANQLSGRLKISNEEQLKPQIQKYLARAKSLQEELRADPKNKDKRVKLLAYVQASVLLASTSLTVAIKLRTHLTNMCTQAGITVAGAGLWLLGVKAFQHYNRSTSVHPSTACRQIGEP